MAMGSRLAGVWGVCVLVGGVALPARAEPPKAVARAAPGGVDAAWAQNGWRAASPVAYVVTRLAAAREAPTTAAAPRFWLKGGARVPVLEQRGDWWRIAWSGGRSGWVRAADLEAAASVVMLDARSGRLVRRLPGRDAWPVTPDGAALWAVSDTGLARLLPGELPALWLRAPGGPGESTSPGETVWSPDHRQAATRLYGHNSANRLAILETATGTIRLATGPEGELSRLDSQGRLLIAQSSEAASQALLYDLGPRQTVGQCPGQLRAAAKGGAVYLTCGRELVRCDAALQPGPRLTLPADPQSVCLSGDERVLAVCAGSWKKGKADFRLTLFDAASLAKIASWPVTGREPQTQILALAGGKGGWSIVASDEGGLPSLTRYTPQGRALRRWEAPSVWAVSPDGSAIYLARQKDMLVVQTGDGSALSIPLTWRRTLPASYLPKPSDPGIRTRFSTSAMRFTPDGRTLVLTEWLNAEPDG
jgi:hypothetical protein